MMKHSLKKTLAAALLALVFLFDVLPMTARAEMSGELWVSGKKVTEKKLSGDGWRYEPKTNTLTLENYTYSGKGKKKKYGDTAWYSGLYYEGDKPLKIVLAGENRITVEDTEEAGAVTCGILCVGNLEIGGEGSLAAIAGAAVESYGVWCWTYTQKGGTVNLAAGKAEGISCGIYTSGDVSVSGGVLESAGTESGDRSFGIWCKGGFVLSGGDVKLTAGKAANSSYGLYNNSGDITFDGGSFSAVSGESGYWNAGIHGMGDMLIHDGTVYASGADITNSNERSGAANGIITEGAITIDGGTVTAEAGNVVGSKQSQGMLAVQGLCINNGTVAAKAGNTNEGSYALVSVGDIIINGGNVTAVSGDAVGVEECDSIGIFAAGENHDEQEGQSSKIFINGGTVFAQGGSTTGTGDKNYSSGIVGYEVTVMGGSVTAVGGQTNLDSCGIGVDGEEGVLIIGPQIQELTAVGAVKAVDGKIRTDVGGAGYTDAAGTEGKTPIPAGEEQAPDLLCVRFPD